MKAKVNGINEFDLSEVVDINVSLSINDDKIIFRKDGINYHARLISQDVQSKKYTIEIEKKLFEVKLEDDLDQLIASMGMKGQRIQNVSEIKSPMPGLVLKLLKQSGEEVTAGETILVLEAMKMENAIKSPIEGVIQSIEVKEGQSLDKGMVLIRF
ncbi:MAG: acetyl-CoA carboxylase biotin carboxyl carrier protein subunit [Saprospiraceae bacterium]|jgi:biotin carboxyl carrier protein|uniref:acetyl-CoA carboxylase biotin carboxyl carrier protein subunit n=1 Tax=Candidatus Brachybacter algidus TaxID=2982024 RepID=UPI001B588A1C|nr:acetyl-CoA carboxylase biotin carboxyl carrier protein subunit [Candidatus Brachybacter algidus]MBP7306136.1 acetyl-CoA carboxylase biotin carboxyl carrier protein subunit [Saprospiraceae bacterium]MBK6372947.1 acetyl-CoA carboxylase biotin carboxyl carrier protein subunit [Candidatus Brachybacter algidus]MBK6448087.1 acetyl-CoA carboxylase biotin carboxyl carrier protein subunit [Candidatus Brachybacter algidus]MBK7602900.1 acetyl-CoA carboxylase biotin carboxyl carrier protein subunit [Can